MLVGVPNFNVFAVRFPFIVIVDVVPGLRESSMLRLFSVVNVGSRNITLSPDPESVRLAVALPFRTLVPATPPRILGTCKL
ncbi:hypothetical protein D3C80_1225960 [compost metagenome]